MIFVSAKNSMSNSLPSQHCFPFDLDCQEATHQELTGKGWRDVEKTFVKGSTTLEKDIDCCTKCGLNPDCEYWVRATDSNSCWLKSNDGQKIEERSSRTRRGGLRPSKNIQ